MRIEADLYPLCSFELFNYVYMVLKYNIQGGSNMTGTDLCVNKCKQSRSYLNHLVCYWLDTRQYTVPVEGVDDYDE